MSCKSCEAGADLAVCLYCGHSFCALHRGESGGLPCCTPCLKAERARKTRPLLSRRDRSSEPTVEVGAPVAPPAELRPLPEPKGWAPVLWGLGAAGGTAAYLHVFLAWLVRRHDLIDWLAQAGTGLGALVAFAGVWAVVKSR